MALAILAASSPTWAVDLDLGLLSVPSITAIGNTFSAAGNYTDTYDFSIASEANAGGLILEIDPSWLLDIAITSVSLSGVTGSLSNLLPDLLTYSFGSVAAGSYTLSVSTSVTGNSGFFNVGYLGSLTLLAPSTSTGRIITAPEPGTLAMYMFGLLVVGFFARRARPGLSARR
jgi:hypothetical protein